jgi:hypothetical protein
VSRVEAYEGGVEQGRQVADGHGRHRVAADRGLADRAAVDQQGAVHDGAADRREGGAHQRDGAGGEHVQQGVDLGPHRPAQRGVDLLEDVVHAVPQ